MTHALNQIDLCFVVDTTGSMETFITEAQRHLLDTMTALRADNGLDLQVGLVEYRDHPPQERSFVTRAYPLTPNFKAMQKAIGKLKADGGGDAPEAVYDALYQAATDTRWRAHSCRFVLLVGDAPPHGAQAHDPSAGTRRGHGDAWANGCPCGLTLHSVTSAAENARATVYALCLGRDTATVEAFTALAAGTGGQCAPVGSATEVVRLMIDLLAAEFQDLAFDGRTLETVHRLGDLDVRTIAESLDCPRLQAAQALARLGKRGFLQTQAA